MSGLVCASRAAPREVPVIGPAPAWVVPTSWTFPDAAQVNPSGQDFLVLDQQVRLASGESYHHHVYQIVSDAGRQNGAQVYFYFDPSYQTLVLHHLKLVRGPTVSDRLDPEKIQVIQQERELDRQLYNGQRSALVILDDVRIGDVIDVAYTLQGENPVFAGKFIDASALEWGVPVRDLRYRLLVPPERRITTKIIGQAAVSPNTGTFDGEQELLWRRSNVPIVESEERVPDSHVVFSFLDVSEFATWADVVRWAEPLYALSREPSPLLDAVVTDLRTRFQSPEQQAVEALAFVQQEVRYLGIEMGPGSHRPSEPEEVLRRRFGDCKDKSRLLAALLTRLGLEATPALVHSDRREAVRNRLPSPYAFDHVITALDFGGRRYLLDPTFSYQRGTGLALRHVGRYGPYLRIAPGAGSNLEEADPGVGDVSRTNLHENFEVMALEQPARLTVTTTAEGRAAEGLRSYFATRTLDQIGREYLNYYTHYYPSITQAASVEPKDQPLTNSFVVTEHYLIDRLFVREDAVLRAEFEPPSIWDYVRAPNLGQRRLPYALSHPTEIQETLSINLPEDWPIKARHETLRDDAFIASYKVSNPRARTVQLEYNWASRAHRVEPSRLAVFSANLAKIRPWLGYQLSWSEPSPAATAPAAGSFPLNWSLVGLSLTVMLGGGYVSWRLVKKRNPIPPEPPLIENPGKPVDPYSYEARTAKDSEGLGGWLILVAFGLIVRPLWLLYTLYDGRAAFYNAAVWERLTSPESQVYNRHFGLIAPLELIVYLFLLTYSVLLIALFFRRSYLFPKTIQLYFVCAVAAAVFMIWDVAMLQPGQVDTSTSMALFQAVVAAAIWIPYFRVSRRVKLTFVR
jgi:hypothetical protein